MLDVGDIFDIDTKYDHNYDCTLGLRIRSTNAIDGATLREISKGRFEIIFAGKILGELEIDI